MKRIKSLLFFLLLGSMPYLYSQTITVTGNVTDESTNEPIPGVNVIVQGTNTGTITDTEGKYTIKANADDVLIFSFIGYVTESQNVGNRVVIDLIMTPDITSLSEVVVIGYGSMERTNVTGAISSIKSEDLSRVPVSNVIEALRGQVSGVRITRSEGSPGSDVDFKIRGVRSLGDPNGSVDANAPLIVVDGIPYSGGKISDINPNDISSIDILKDAAATSIYGSSASNGVILITTKSGVSGKPSLNVTYSRGITELAQKPTLFNGEEYAQMKIDAIEGNPNNKKPLTPESVLDPIELANFNAGKSIDWHDVMLRKGQVNQFGLSLTGGSEKFSYYLNGELYNETGIVQHSDYNRYSFRVNTDYSPYKFVTIGAKTQLTLTNSDETGTALGPNNRPDFTAFLGDSPLGRIYDSTGALVPTVNGDQFPILRLTEKISGHPLLLT
jgi:TonB-linked SusC/RagA family outer membrane protein